MPIALSADPITWVFTGDSITQGLIHTRGGRSYTEHFHERVRGELQRFRDCVINTGISGNRTSDLLADFPHRVARFTPTVVSVMLGTNDAVAGPAGRQRYADELAQILTRIRQVGAQPLLQTPPPIDEMGAPTRVSLPDYVAVARDVAATHDVDLVDHHAHWLARRHGRVPTDWLNDAFHPNGRGHLEIANLLFRHFDLFDLASPVCRLSAVPPELSPASGLSDT